MATVLDLVGSHARIDATRRLCDAQRRRLAAIRRGDRRHGDAAHLLALAEDALSILLTIHKLLVRLEGREPAVPQPQQPMPRAATPRAPVPFAPVPFAPVPFAPEPRTPHPLRRAPTRSHGG